MSLTYSGLYISLLGFLAQAFKLPISNEEITQIVTGALQVIGIIVAAFGRYRAGGVTVGGFRKA